MNNIYAFFYLNIILMRQKLILIYFLLFWGTEVTFSQIKVTRIVVNEQDKPVIDTTIQVKREKLKRTIADISGKDVLKMFLPEYLSNI